MRRGTLGPVYNVSAVLTIFEHSSSHHNFILSDTSFPSDSFRSISFNCFSGVGFVRNILAPLIMVSCCIEADTTAVSISIVVGGNFFVRSKCRILRVAVKPSITGIDISATKVSLNFAFAIIGPIKLRLTHYYRVISIDLEFLQGFLAIGCSLVLKPSALDTHLDNLSLTIRTNQSRKLRRQTLRLTWLSSTRRILPANDLA